MYDKFKLNIYAVSPPGMVLQVPVVVIPKNNLKFQTKILIFSGEKHLTKLESETNSLARSIVPEGTCNLAHHIPKSYKIESHAGPKLIIHIVEIIVLI